ncbi:MAG: DNA ligase D [Bacteroidales bacterium]
MSLSKYKEKRKFEDTPEPDAPKAKSHSLLSFVVQRHEASRLHYDFRLEMEGVLKSWAVPKGPSMVAGEKRLAIMVEDHPLDYGEFTGVIPEGNYGAGVVEIWDQGVVLPVKKGDDPPKVLSDQLQKGDLKFVLQGRHLKGEFALVRMKNQQQNQWLMIKKQDDYAVDHYDIEKISPIRKINRKTALKENTTKKPSRKKKQAAPQDEDFPSQVPKPMLASPTKKIIDDPDWIYEPKYDGYRMISAINKGKAALYSRNGHSFNEKYEILAKELKKIKDRVILDGEVVIENQKGVSDFQLLQNYNSTKKGVLKYYVFDILYLNGTNTGSLSLANRKELLEMFFNKYKLKNVFNSTYQQGGGKELFDNLAAKGYEGVIAKNPEGQYLPGKRNDGWLKVKAHMMQEAVIAGYTLPQKGRKYFGSLILGLYDGGALKYIGNCGTGFNDVSLKELYQEFEKRQIEESPFKEMPKLSWAKGKPVWIKPELVCNVKFTEWSQEGRMRHPVFMGLRTDKDAEEVEKELPVDIKKKEHPKQKTFTISGRKVKCTNLTKVFWPDEGYTKGDLIAYYRAVSRYMVPYLINRPQSLNRHPNGINGKSFYQKNMNVKQLPDWVKTVKVYSGSNESAIDYLVCNDAATLVYMANLGCIEINPWHSTFQKPDNPTYMMLDLDPAKIAFKEVVNTALVIKEICDEIDIPCYCKTSGATGLHVFIPLGARYSYDQVKTFAEIMAVITHQRLPEVTSVERSTSKRKDKVYVDFLQNRKAQTLAAPYSVRPQPGATVSAPLRWEEVNHQLSPQMFTIKNMMQRLDAMGDIWSPVLKEKVALNKALKAVERLI